MQSHRLGQRQDPPAAPAHAFSELAVLNLAGAAAPWATTEAARRETAARALVLEDTAAPREATRALRRSAEMACIVLVMSRARKRREWGAKGRFSAILPCQHRPSGSVPLAGRATGTRAPKGGFSRRFFASQASAAPAAREPRAEDQPPEAARPLCPRKAGST